MADELDPRLEASLRAALHHEAGQLQVLVTADDIEQARRRRRARRLALPASLLGAAAVIAVMVVVAGAWRANESIVAASPSPSSTPSAGDRALLARLPGFDRLAEPAIGSVEVLRDEGVATPGATSWSHAFTDGPFTYEYLLACLGDTPLEVWLTVDGLENRIGPITCDGGLNNPSWAGDRRLDAETVSVRLEAAPGTAWRLLVIDDEPDASPGAGACVPLTGGNVGRSLQVTIGLGQPMALTSFATLAWQTFDGQVVTGAVGSWPAVGGPLGIEEDWYLTFDTGQYCLDSVVGSVASRADYDAASEAGTEPLFTPLPTNPRPDGSSFTVAELGVGHHVVQLVTSWHRADGGDDTDAWLLPIEVLAPGPAQPLRSFEELADGVESTVELGRGGSDGGATDPSTPTVLGHTGGATDLELAITCDLGSVSVSFIVDGVLQPSGTSVDCGHDTTGVLVDAPETTGGHSVAVAIEAPGRTSWRAIAYDHGRDRKLTRLVAPDIPGSTVLGAISGASAAGDSNEMEADVSRGTGLVVAIACRGSGAITITVDGTTWETPCEPSTILDAGPATGSRTRLRMTQDGPVDVNLQLRAVAP